MRAALRRFAPSTADGGGRFASGEWDSVRSCWAAASSSEEGLRTMLLMLAHKKSDGSFSFDCIVGGNIGKLRAFCIYTPALPHYAREAAIQLASMLWRTLQPCH
jgi:hypothetical protein